MALTQVELIFDSAKSAEKGLSLIRVKAFRHGGKIIVKDGKAIDKLVEQTIAPSESFLIF